MLIKLFRTNQPAILLGLPVVAAMFWWVYYVRATHSGGLSQEAELISSLSLPFWILISGQLILTMIEGIVFNRILNDLELFEKQSFVPALCYVIISATVIPGGSLQVTSVPNFFILQATHSLLVSYRQNSAKREAFESGFLIGIGSLIWWPLAILYLFGIIALNLLKSFNWREPLLFLGGLLWPGFSFSAVYFAINGSWYFPDFELYPDEMNFNFLKGNELHFTLFAGSLLFLMISGFFLFFSRLQGTILKVRKQRMVWMWLSLFMILLMVIHPVLPGAGMPLLVIPCAFTFSFLLVHTSFTKLFYAAFYLMLAFFFFHQFYLMGFTKSAF